MTRSNKIFSVTFSSFLYSCFLPSLVSSVLVPYSLSGLLFHKTPTSVLLLLQSITETSIQTALGYVSSTLVHFLTLDFQTCSNLYSYHFFKKILLITQVKIASCFHLLQRMNCIYWHFVFFGELLMFFVHLLLRSYIFLFLNFVNVNVIILLNPFSYLNFFKCVH